MCLICVYNDLEDKIICHFWYPDNQAMLDVLFKHFQRVHHDNGIYFGVKYSSLSLH